MDHSRQEYRHSAGVLQCGDVISGRRSGGGCLRTVLYLHGFASSPAGRKVAALTELLAEDNKISSLPPDFTDSTTLRVADFTGNDFSKLDERIALMDALESFRVDANPLRERKFLSMKTPELKADLRRRLEVPAHVNV